MFSRFALVAGLTSLVLVGGTLFLLIGSTSATIDNSDSSFSNNAAVQNNIVNADEASTKDGHLSCCEYRSTTNEWKPYIFVSTLDGRISAIDASSEDGRIAWTMQTDAEPLLSSSLSNIPFYANDDEYRLIPSLDGHLYMYNDAAVQSVPFNMEALLSGSLKLGADILAGGKQIRTYFVDYATGKIYQTCGATGCEHFGDELSSAIAQKLIIKRTTQTVRAVDMESGGERWNVTVGEHELLLDDKEETPETEDTCICMGDNAHFRYGYRKTDSQSTRSAQSDWKANDLGNVDLKIVPPQGSVLAYDKDDPSVLLWETKLDSPIVQIWTLLPNGKLVERTIFDHTLVPAFSYYSISDAASAELRGRTIGGQMERTIYIGTYSDQKYVIRSPEERRKSKELRSYNPMDQGRVYLLAPAGPLQVEDQSRTTDNGHCENDCPTCASDEVNALILRDQYPRDMGWYLYKHKTSQHRLPALGDSSKPATKKKFDQHTFAQWIDQLATGKFILLILGILSAFFVPTALVARFYMKRLKEMTEAAEKCALLQEQQKSRSDTSLATTPATETTHLTPSPTSQESLNILSDLVSDLSGRSYGRYTSDFEPLCQLGRGGFGIVVESRNKHDDQLYAVKRIAFALKRSAKERVRREVKALAQLEHPGIVRYFSAWFEEPPADWQKKVDREMFQKCHRITEDELNFESQSGTDLSIHLKTKDKLERLTQTVGSFGDVLENKHDDGENPSTFGSWTTDRQISTTFDEKLPNRNEFNANFDRDDLKLELPERPPPQESVEIIFANSSTNAEPVVLPTEIVRRRNRKSSSSKQSSTKSEEDNSGHNNENNNNHTKIEAKSTGTAYLYIQMQLCRGTLKDWLLNNNLTVDRNRSVMLDWFDQLVCAMQYVHDLGLVHRDLKPSNIFFSTTGYLKIGDFGLATTSLPSILPSDAQFDVGGLAAGDNKNSWLTSAATFSPSRGTTDRVGTQLYMSPEQEAGRKCTSKADIYALGLIFIELLIPFNTLMERVHVIQDARKNIFDKKLEIENAQEFELIRRLLARDPEMRPTCLEIRQSDLFNSCLSIRPLSMKNDQFQPGRTMSRDSGRHSSVSLNTP